MLLPVFLKNNGSLARLERLNAGESLADLVAEVAVEKAPAVVKSQVEVDTDTKPVEAVADVEGEAVETAA